MLNSTSRDSLLANICLFLNHVQRVINTYISPRFPIWLCKLKKITLEPFYRDLKSWNCHFYYAMKCPPLKLYRDILKYAFFPSLRWSKIAHGISTGSEGDLWNPRMLPKETTISSKLIVMYCSAQMKLESQLVSRMNRGRVWISAVSRTLIFFPDNL